MKEVEVVPCTWIQGDTCQWPKWPSDKVQLIKKGRSPGPDYTEYQAKVKGIFDKLQPLCPAQEKTKCCQRGKWWRWLSTSSCEFRNFHSRCLLLPATWSYGSQWNTGTEINRYFHAIIVQVSISQIQRAFGCPNSCAFSVTSIHFLHIILHTVFNNLLFSQCYTVC